MGTVIIAAVLSVAAYLGWTHFGIVLSVAVALAVGLALRR